MLAALLCGAMAVSATDVEFVQSVLRLRESEPRLALRDLDGDGRLEAVFLRADGVGVRYLDEDGRYSDQERLFAPWPAASVAWDLADLQFHVDEVHSQQGSCWRRRRRGRSSCR